MLQSLIHCCVVPDATMGTLSSSSYSSSCRCRFRCAGSAVASSKWRLVRVTVHEIIWIPIIVVLFMSIDIDIDIFYFRVGSTSCSGSRGWNGVWKRPRRIVRNHHPCRCQIGRVAYPPSIKRHPAVSVVFTALLPSLRLAEEVPLLTSASALLALPLIVQWALPPSFAITVMMQARLGLTIQNL